MQLSPAILAALPSIGVVDPDKSPQRELAPNWEKKIFFAEVVCWCDDRAPKRVTMVPLEVGTASILVGQCSECRTIIWCRWPVPGREWTGQRMIEAARPMHEKGHGC